MGFWNGSPLFTVPRMVPPRRRMPVTSRGVSSRDFSGIDQTIEAVFQADDRHARVVGRFHDGADDGVQTGSVTAAGENANFFDGGHRSAREGRRRIAADQYGNRVLARSSAEARVLH